MNNKLKIFLTFFGITLVVSGIVMIFLDIIELPISISLTVVGIALIVVSRVKKSRKL
jgi:hypothetical protein